jgi:GNAT superfamily N-acetyltransferase
MRLSETIDRYVVLRLRLKDYGGTARVLPDGFTLAGAEARSRYRAVEQRLLQECFEQWRAPFEGLLKGWRADSPVMLLHGGALIGGVYLCDQAEVASEEGWGQLHYAFIHPRYRGQGLYSVLFHEAVERADRWGLVGLILNSDRALLPEVYTRWGAVHDRVIPKASHIRFDPLGLLRRGIGTIKRWRFHDCGSDGVRAFDMRREQAVGSDKSPCVMNPEDMPRHHRNRPD